MPRPREGVLIDSPEDDSPYPEVRSAVANTDDPTMPVSSLRTWVIGLIWAIIIPGMNQFFFFRYPSVSVGGVCRAHNSHQRSFDRFHSQIVAQLLSLPVGRAWAKFMPNYKIFGVSLNPGPFTVKEHVLITIMASVGAGSAYAVGLQIAEDIEAPLTLSRKDRHRRCPASVLQSDLQFRL